MTLARWISGAFGVSLAAGAMSVAMPAGACSIATCSSPVRLPPSPYLPGNLVYFQVLGEDDPSGLQLRTAEGEPIAASVRDVEGDRVFAPEQPIAEGTAVVLEYSTLCFGEPARQTFELTTTAPGAIELEPARLTVQERGVAGPGRFDEASFVRVRHWPGDTNGVASPLMIHSASVDGVPVGTVDVAGQSLLEILVPCRPPVASPGIDTCGNLFAAPPGVHLVQVSTHIVGAATQPEPVGLEVEVQCPDAIGGGPIADPEPAAMDGAPDAGTPPASGAEFTPWDGESDIPLNAPPAATQVSSGDGSCALAGAGSAATSGGSALLAIAAALGVARVRRRQG
jgi:hypothetical protein